MKSGRWIEIRPFTQSATFPLEEAQVLYKLCSGVNYYMADEMTRL